MNCFHELSQFEWFLLKPLRPYSAAEHSRLLRPAQGEALGVVSAVHPSCFGNLCGGLASFGIEPDAIPTTFNIFMNVDVLPTGEPRIGPPRSRP